MGMMKKQYYYMHKGKKIVSGTILKVKNHSQFKEMAFVWYVPESDIFCMYDPKGGHGYGWSREEFNRYAGVPTDKINREAERQGKSSESITTWSFSKELKNDGMFFGWMLYIVLMALFFIFNGRIVLWTLTSIVFFSYRAGKLKEEGYRK